jgi:D-beta-D-heptose 7-phosphate kinase/D-beta-D-heptose 1-phosphate adenosyltransferase
MENLQHIMRLVERDFCDIHVLVVGDVMLDKYIWGEVERISPEAPVPVVRVGRRHEQPGGAANVGMNLSGLGAKVTLLGFGGGDNDQQALERQLIAAGVVCRLISNDNIPTTSKLRILGGNQQMMRLDIESRAERPAAAYEVLLRHYEAALRLANIVILSDYGKGVLTEALCRSLIQAARAARVPILVDPKNPDFSRYRGATTICPNLRELSVATATSSRNVDEVLAAGQEMIGMLDLEFLTVTLSEHGIAVLYPDRRILLPAVARKVFDVSGAGDTVIATLGLAIAGLLPVETAAQLANVAAGVVVGKVGTVPIQRHELIGALSDQSDVRAEQKVFDLNQLLTRASFWRASGDRLVFTNGCFDILHIGHISLLAAAKCQGDRLIVAINGDQSIQRPKGPSRPLVGSRERAQVLSAIAAVDAVVVYEEDTPLALIRALRPDVLVKGGNFAEDTVVGAAETEGWGGVVRIVPLIEGFSTAEIMVKAFTSDREAAASLKRDQLTCARNGNSSSVDTGSTIKAEPF